MATTPEVSANIAGFSPSEADRAVYSKINWRELFKNRDSFMKGFCDTIINPAGFDVEINNLMKDIFGYTASRADNNKKHYVNIDYYSLASQKCQDMNYTFAIRETMLESTSKVRARRFFHIALHSEFPKYNGVLEGRKSCGLYPKKAEEDLGSGSFHYKMDSYPDNKFSFKKLSEESSPPYRTFEFNADATMKDNSSTEFNIREGTEAHALFIALPKANQVNLIKLHNIIYKKFIDYWNKHIHNYLVSRTSQTALLGVDFECSTV